MERALEMHILESVALRPREQQPLYTWLSLQRVDDYLRVACTNSRYEIRKRGAKATGAVWLPWCARCRGHGASELMHDGSSGTKLPAGLPRLADRADERIVQGIFFYQLQPS